MNNTELKVLDLINQITKNKLTDQDMEISLELFIDSIEFINLIVKIEENFKIEFADEMLMIDEMKSIKTIGEYIDLAVAEKRRS